MDISVVESRKNPVPQPAAGRVGHLVIERLSKRYHDQQAVRDISLEILPGEFVALLGPSGCGKTTLLRCIAGLVTPTSGDILLDGASIISRPVHRRDLGMVFQSYALFPHMCVRDNVAFPLKMRGIPRAQAAERAIESLRMVRMDSLAHRMPDQLSGGQQQRVALARAVCGKPRVLLLDEPLSALDAKLREAMQVELRELQRELGITTLFVTHDQTEALVTADRIAVLNGGNVEQFDSPEASYIRPATLFVADFIGKMNRLPATVTAASAREVVVRLDRLAVERKASSSARLSPGQAVVGVLRPERVRVVTDDPGAGVEGVVREAIFMGEKLTLYVDTPCGLITVSQPNLRREGRHQLAAGSRIRLDWEPEDFLVFAAP